MAPPKIKVGTLRGVAVVVIESAAESTVEVNRSGDLAPGLHRIK